MIYEILAQIMVEDALREADKNRLIEIANRSRKIQNRQRLAKLACRFGLTQIYKRVRAIMSRQHLDIKDVRLVERIESNALCCGPETRKSSS